MNKFLFLILFVYTTSDSLNAQNGGNCRNAISISPGSYVVDSMILGGASFSHIYPKPTRAKWFKYTPSQDGLMRVSSCGGQADTRLFMYSGTCDTLNLFGFNDDFCPKDSSGEETASDIAKFVKAGKTYYIEWDNAWDSVRFNFSLSFSTSYVPTAMQACSSAKTINAGTTAVDSLIGFASHGDAGHANWYKFTPASNGKLSISTCGIDVDTRLWIYKGACNALIPVSESDDECDGATQKEIAVAISDLSVFANTTYYLEWDDSWEDAPFQFNLFFDPASNVVEEGFSKNIILTPNPASDWLDVHFNLDKMTAIEWTIFYTIGQPISTHKMSSILRGVEKIYVGDLTAGMYIIQISDGLKTTNKKLIINR